MGDLTTNLGLYQPDNGETGWGDEVNNNAAVLDDLELEHVKGIGRNVLKYGADPSGATDSTAAINDTIEACFATYADSSGPEGFCYIPGGRFRIEGTIQGIGGVRIQGSGPMTCLMPFNGSDPVIASPGADSHRDWGVSDLTIGVPQESPYATYGTGYYTDTALVTTGTGHGIYVDSGTGAQFRNVNFFGLKGTDTWCIYLDSHLEGQIYNCPVHACAGGGFYIGGTVNPSNASVVRDCVMSNSASGAIGAILVAASGVLLEGNVIESWRGDYGVRIEPPTGSGIGSIVISRNWFEDNSGVVLDMVGPGVQDVTVINSGGAPKSASLPDKGLQIKSGRRIHIQDCSFGSEHSYLTSEAISGRQTTVQFVNCTGTPPDMTGLVNLGEDQVIAIGCSDDWGSETGVNGAGMAISRGNLVLGQFYNSYIQMAERTTEPDAPPTNNVRIVALENGGKTKLYARFATGALQLIAAEP